MDKHSETAVGSGRTWRLVNDARDGDILIVETWRDRDDVMRMLQRMGRRRDALLLFSYDWETANRLRGFQPDRRVYIDHRLHTLAEHQRAHNSSEYAAFAAIEATAALRYGGVHYFPVADPCDTGSPGSSPASEPGLAGASGA